MRIELHNTEIENQTWISRTFQTKSGLVCVDDEADDRLFDNWGSGFLGGLTSNYDDCLSNMTISDIFEFLG